jgi:uncharacterized protein YycO
MGLRMMFTNSNKIGSFLIRWVTWSDYSHTALLIDDTRIAHADFSGVHVEDIQSLKDRSKKWMIVEYEYDKVDEVIQACLEQVGKPYDYSGIVGILLRNVDLQDDSKWWCSEYPAGGCKKAGKPMFQDEYMSRITPQHWLMLPHTVLDKS